MADYFFLHDADDFTHRLRPALTACRRRRSFAPARGLCADLAPAARAYAERYHTGAIPSLVEQLADGLFPFDRGLWRGLVGEVLLYAAVEVPQFQTCEDTLARLLAPEDLPTLRQAHHGSRDLTFGPAVYRPGQAGFNDAADVARLRDRLDAIDSEGWDAARLVGLPDLAEEDIDEELAFAREWFPVLRDLFRSCQERRLVVVHEVVYGRTAPSL
jgi:hypothetical protein